MLEFWDALQMGFMQRALLAGIITGIVCPVIGTFLVLRRLALIADGLAHVSFAGIAGGLLLQWHPLVGALVVAVVGAFGIERLRASRKAAGDVSIAIYSSLGMGGGIVLLKLAGGLNMDLFSFLFGSLVTVRPTDLMLIAGLALFILLLVGLLYKEFLSTTVDEEAARASGIPVSVINLIFVVMTALTVVVAMRVVGLLLVTALMVLPVAASLQVASGLGRTLLYAVGFGLGSVLLGIMIAYLIDLPAGGAVVLTSVALFGLSSLLGAMRQRVRRPLESAGGI